VSATKYVSRWAYYEDYGIGERDEIREQVWAYYEDYGIGERDELREQVGVLRGDVPLSPEHTLPVTPG
jgi:hypothetical protein